MLLASTERKVGVARFAFLHFVFIHITDGDSVT